MPRAAWAVMACVACGRVGFDGTDGGSPGTGSNGGDGDGSATGDGSVTGGPYNIAFVTSTSVAPNALGGIAGADATCNSLAASADLPGTYVAWLSDANANAPARLGQARGWIRVDGKPLVDTVQDLLDGKLLHPILFDETGAAQSGQFGILTGTAANGTAASNCLGYTSTAGSEQAMTGIASATLDTWTANLATACDRTFRHYCFGIDHSTPLTYTPATGPRAFLSAALWSPNGGISGADAACQAAADAQSLGGTWQAFMANTTSTAAGRFSAAGEPWVRLDGIRLTASRSALLAGDMLDAPLNLTETGVFRGSNPGLTGATSPTVFSTAGDSCVNWSSIGGGDMHRVALVNSVTLYFSTFIFQTCSSGGGYLYCLEL